MHRIDTEGHVAGQWQDGDPQIGQQGTIMSAAWLNDTQENIVKVILDAGIALAKGNTGQLKAAIQAMITSSAVNWAPAIATAKAEAIAAAATATATAKAEAIATANAAMTAAVATAKAEAIAATRLRVGTVIMIDGPFDSTGGYVELDTEYLRASYPDLVALYNAQGRLIAGSTGAHFRTPDYQGLFARAAATNTARDPDGPRAIGSIQADAFKSHDHSIPSRPNDGSADGYVEDADSSMTPRNTRTGLTGDAETRPKNVAFTWAIKT